MYAFERERRARGDLLPQLLQRARFEAGLYVRDGHTEEFLPRVPEALAGLAVHVDEAAFEVVHEDGVGGLLDEALEAVLAPAERELTLPLYLHLPELALDGGAQPAHVLFGEVVVGPGLHDLHRRVLPHLAGDDDERHVGVQLPQQLQGRGGPEAGHVVVGDYDLEGVTPGLGGAPRLLHAFGGVDPLVDGLVPAPTELPQQEHGVVLGVLDEQHA